MTLESLHDTHWWYKIRKYILKKFLKKNLEAGSRVLEIGSATGANTVAMSALGYLVTSLEFSTFGVEAQKKKGLRVIQGDARRLPFEQDSFEAVVCMDVLEHIVEDDLVLSEIYRVLKPGGIFLISVPEDPSMWSSHDTAVDHVRRYQKVELVEKICRCGLIPNSVRSTNFLLKPAVRLKRKKAIGSDLTQMNWFMNGFLLLLAYFDQYFSNSMVSGLTVWVTGQK